MEIDGDVKKQRFYDNYDEIDNFVGKKVKTISDEALLGMCDLFLNYKQLAVVKKKFGQVPPLELLATSRKLADLGVKRQVFNSYKKDVRNLAEFLITLHTPST